MLDLRAQVFSKDGVASSGFPEYVMCFQPPLVVHNVLPYPITVILQDSSYQAEPSQFTIGVGGFVEVYQFDMSRKIRMSIKLEVPSCRLSTGRPSRRSLSELYGACVAAVSADSSEYNHCTHRHTLALSK